MIEGENNRNKNTQNREGRGMLMMAMTSGTEQDEGMVLRRVVEMLPMKRREGKVMTTWREE